MKRSTIFFAILVSALTLVTHSKAWIPPPSINLKDFVDKTPRGDLDTWRHSHGLDEVEFTDLFDNGNLLKKLLPWMQKGLETHHVISSSQQGHPSNADNALSCAIHTGAYLQALRDVLNGSVAENWWAVQMLDATGKLPDGIFHGNWASLGDFDECLEIRAHLKSVGFPAEKANKKPDFKGQHCTVRLIPTFAIPGTRMTSDSEWLQMIVGSVDPNALMQNLPKIGICIPSTCSAAQFEQALFSALNGTGIYPLLYDTNCFVDEGVSFDAADYVVIFVIALVVFTAAAGTAVDYQMMRKKESPKTKGPGVQALLAFSVITNGRKLLSTKKTPATLDCLHGIRFISMSWVVLGHTYAIGIQTSFSNFAPGIKYMLRDGAFDAVVNGTVSVDTFFLLSGLMVAYVLFRDLERSAGKFNLPLFYLHRYLRLTPPIAISLAVFATFVPKLYASPYWNGASATAGVCQQMWWRTLLYVQNIPSFQPEITDQKLVTDATVGCIGQLWYVSNDMQMYLFAPLVLLPLFYRPSKAAFAWIGFVAIGAAVAPMIVIWHYDLAATMLPMSATTQEYFEYIYTASYSRAGPYVIGLIFGYLLHRTRGKKLILPKWVVYGGWLTASVTGLAIVYGLRRYISLEEPSRPQMSRAESILYGGLHRSLWGLCVGWVVFACVHGYGGWINKFLSWKLFMPLGRLTYCSYLLSLMIQQIYQWSRKTVPHLDHLTMLYWFFGTMVLTISCAFVMSLLFEAPIIGLEKIIFAPCTGNAFSKKKTTADDEKNIVTQEDPEKGHENGGLKISAE